MTCCCLFVFEKLNKGIPTDKRFVDEYLNGVAKTKELLIQWLEDFKSKFERYELAQETISSVNTALQLYREKIDSSTNASINAI
jgi:hypothetical protein